MRLRLEQRRIDLEACFHMFFGHDRTTGSDATDERQANLLTHRVHQSYAARCARHERDDSLTGECPQMLFGCISGLEAELSCDFHTSGRHAGFTDKALDETQDLSLARRQV